MKRNAILLALGLGVALVVAAVTRTPSPDPAGAPAPVVGRTAAGAADSPPAFRVAGLMVNTPTGDPGASFEELAFMGTFSRTRMAIELQYPAGGLIDLDRDACTLQVFEDDGGTSLLDPDEAFGPFEMMPRVAESTRSVVFVIGTKKMPAGTARTLRAKGTVAVMVSNGKTTYEAKDVSLEAGESFELGPWTFEVTGAAASDWNEGHWATTLETTTDPAAIVSWSLVGAGGAPLEWSPTMSMSGGGSWSQTLEAGSKLERATVRVEAWVDPKIVEIPFDLRAGLGLR